MNRYPSIDRRTYLAATATASSIAIAGCPGSLTGTGSDEPQRNTHLPEPDRQVDATDLPYPAYAQQLPDVTLPAPLRDEEVSVGQLDTDVFVTFFYSYCQTVCPRLVGSLRHIQTKAIKEGYGDEVTFLAITFDPERDTESRLREYASGVSIDTEAGNWYFLRPETVERAEGVVEDEFGVAFQRTEPEDMDMYMFDHFSLILLGNANGYVERAYTNKRPAWQELYDDFTTLRERKGEDATA